MKNLNIVLVLLFVFTAGVARSQNSTNELNVGTLSDQINEPVVSGFYNRINFGVLGGSNSSLSFNIINGYCINEHWSVGLGLGVEQFAWNHYVPAFIEGNYNIWKGKTSPWINAMAGYQVPFRNIGSNQGGFTCGGKVGISHFVGKHFGITTSLGYRYAHLIDQTNWWGWDSFVTISNINRFEFRVGMVFK